MGVLSDQQIEELANKGMITPYDPGHRKPGKISSGVTSYGYDVRLGYKFKAPTGARLTAAVIDPKNPDPDDYLDTDLTPNLNHTWEPKELSPLNHKQIGYQCHTCGVWKDTASELYQCTPRKADHIIIPPHSFVLGESIETFDIPRDILVVCLGKSTYARTGIIVNVTPGEPEWKGIWTIELSNTNPKPVKVYCGEGIMQAIFLRSDQIIGSERGVRLAGCQTSYKDKKGKYQGQTGLTLPTVDKEKT